jgi:hypothetical protein
VGVFTAVVPVFLVDAGAAPDAQVLPWGAPAAAGMSVGLFQRLLFLLLGVLELHVAALPQENALAGEPPHPSGVAVGGHLLEALACDEPELEGVPSPDEAGVGAAVRVLDPATVHASVGGAVHVARGRRQARHHLLVDEDRVPGRVPVVLPDRYRVRDYRVGLDRRQENSSLVDLVRTDCGPHAVLSLAGGVDRLGARGAQGPRTVHLAGGAPVRWGGYYGVRCRLSRASH